MEYSNKLKQSLETIAQKDEADRDDFPDEKTFRQGVEKTYLPPKPREGFFGKIADFFKMGHLGATTLADDVLKLPLKITFKNSSSPTFSLSFNKRDFS